MAINAGWDGGIYVGADTKELAHITNWEISFAGDALENTAFGDTVYDRSFQPGLRSHTITFSGYTEDDDSGQDILFDDQKSTDEPNLLRIVVLHERETSEKAGWVGNSVVTGLTVGTPVDGLSPISGTLQISGGLATYSTCP